MIEDGIMDKREDNLDVSEQRLKRLLSGKGKSY